MTAPLLHSDEAAMIRESVGRLFAASGGAQTLRRHRDNRDLRALAYGAWQEMAELGLAGTLAPASSGGMGLGYRESMQISEMMGRSLITAPFLSTAVMAVTALSQGSNERLRRDVLPTIIAGNAIVAIASEESARHNPFAIETTARRESDGLRVSGRKVSVIDGNVADSFIVAARDGDASGDILLLLVDARSPGVSVSQSMGLDSLPLVKVNFDSALAVGAEPVCPPTRTPGLLEQVFDAGRIHLAAEMLGLAQEAFDRTVEYLKTRVQFGRKIGEFQALQHRAAILFGELEVVRSVILKSAILHDDADDRFAGFASLAKARAGEVAKRVTAEALHMHGGLGMTDDFDLGFYLKRVRCAAELLGDTAFHLERHAVLQGI